MRVPMIVPMPWRDAKTVQRFWAGIRSGGESSDQCWDRASEGNYGTFRADGVVYQAHRLAWILANKTTVPAEMMVLHRCNRPSCVNPEHLRLGTAKDNAADAMAAGTHIACTRGRMDRLKVQVPRDVREWIEAEAARRDYSVSGVIRGLVAAEMIRRGER